MEARAVRCLEGLLEHHLDSHSDDEYAVVAALEAAAAVAAVAAVAVAVVAAAGKSEAPLGLAPRFQQE